jgi:hypothetical protein
MLTIPERPFPLEIDYFQLLTNFRHGFSFLMDQVSLTIYEWRLFIKLEFMPGLVLCLAMPHLNNSDGFLFR